MQSRTVYRSLTSGIVAGDDLVLPMAQITVDPTDPVSQAVMTVKSKIEDPDSSALFQAPGNVIATGGTGDGDGTPEVEFPISAAQSELLAPTYVNGQPLYARTVYDMVVELVGGGLLTTQRGDLTADQGVQDSPVLWTPTSYGSDLLQWQRPATIPIGAAATWLDSGGTANRDMKASASKEPIGSANALDGHSRLDPDRVDDFMTLAGNPSPDDEIRWLTSTPVVAVFVLQTPPTLASRVALLTINPSSSFLSIETDGSLQVFAAFTGTTLTAAGAFVAATDYLIEFYRDDAAGVWEVYRNGVNITVPGGPINDNVIAVSQIFAVDGFDANGPGLYEFFTATKDATASDKAGTNAWAKAKYPSLGIA